MRLDPNIGHTGRDSSADVVKFPGRLYGVDPVIELLLTLAPIGEANSGTITEQVIPCASLHRPKDIQRRRR
jgi:hypothetical protein